MLGNAYAVNVALLTCLVHHIKIRKLSLFEAGICLEKRRLKIWIVAIIEPLPIETGARLLRYGKFTQFLADAGHDVTYWTSNFSHAPKKHIVPEDAVLKTHPNLTLQILAGPGYRTNVSLDRIRHQKNFAERFLIEAEKENLPDVILSPIPVLEVAEAVTKFGKKHSIPTLVDVRDCWPEEFVRLLPKPFRFLGPVLFHNMFQKAKFACENATAITGVSTDFLNYGLEMGHRTRTALDRLMPIGYRQEPLTAEQVQAGDEWLKTLNLKPDDFVLCFFGTIGRFFDLETVIQAAQLLREKPVKFILAGSGDSFEKYKTMAKDCANVIFPGWVKDHQIQAVLRRSQVGLAPYRKGALMTMPNKPFEYMAGRLPVLASFKGELADQIVEKNCGFTYTADNASELKDRIETMMKNPDLCRTMGQNARSLYEKSYSLDVIFPQFEKLLADVASTKAT